MKIISTVEQWLVNGVWLPLNTEVDVDEAEIETYLKLAGVKVVTEATSAATDTKTELLNELTNLETKIEKEL